MITPYDIEQQNLERALADEAKCVCVVGHGFVAHATVAEWAHEWVQDNEVAIEVADRMVRYGGEYEWNQDEPEFYMEFKIRYEDEFKRQLVAFKIETRRNG